MKYAITCLLLGVSGCAGALGVYVPGSGNKSGTWQGATPIGGGMAQITTYDYAVGEDGFGVALGAKIGQSWASYGDTSLDAGLAGEAHADFSYCRGRFGGIFEAAFGADRGTTKDMAATEVSYGGFSLGAVGQAVIIPRIAVHLGLHKLLTGGVQVGDADSVTAHGWRIGTGVDLTAYRGTKNEFILRVDLRHTRSGDAMMGTTDISFVGNALLAELVWVSTP
jgi:hypothetical protein